MKGEVLYFDDERGIGFANGDDGNRYHFDRGDLPAGYAPRKGIRIAFTPSGNRAGAIQPEGGFVVAPAPDSPARSAPAIARPTSSVPQVTSGVSPPPSAAAASAPGDRSLWGYFKGCVTSGYMRFGGRARRKEYWGFVLFFLLTTLALTAIAGIVDGVLGNLDRDEPIFTVVVPVLFVLSMILPSLAVTVRRVHDIGLSGWFVLLGLIPTVGNLIILVFALIPSQGKANRWGEVPPGAL